MTGESTIPKSLVDQILDEMFSRLKGQKDFDTHAIQELEKVALNRQLADSEQVSRAIQSPAVPDNETP